MAAEPAPPHRTWVRRFSQPAAPSNEHQNERPGPSSYLSSLSIPPLRSNIGALQSALLGYLGEVESAIRERLQGDGNNEIRAASVRSDSCPPSEDTEEELGHSTALPEPLGQLRSRHTPATTPIPPNHTSDSNSPETHLSILNQLNTLREDVLAYLPTRLAVSVPVPRPPTLNREWLRSLPSKLRAVDLGLYGQSPVTPNSTSNPDKGKERDSRIDFGAVEGARQKVIELVHALTPSEDWAGREKLGWEDQDQEMSFNDKTGSLQNRNHLRLSGGATADYNEEETEDEPEFLFPNRTPASAKAIANRRRVIRSKSLGSAGFPRSWTGYGTFDISDTLARSTTEPKLARWNSHSPVYKRHDLAEVLVDSEDDDDDDDNVGNNDLESGEDDATQILLHPDLFDTKLTKIEAHAHDGITIAEALERSCQGKRLISYDDLPIWWRNNEHIIGGYRFIPLHANTGPIPLIKSAFTLHNETVNIHTHFIPTLLLLFIIIPLTLWKSPLPDAHVLDTVSLISYLCAAVACLISSAGWHVLSGCAARKWFEWGACVDYIGISWLIAASFGTVVYNGFYCHPKTVLFYSSTNLICGAAGSIVPFQKWFNERRNKAWRIAFFLTLCAAMVAPMVQMFWGHGWEKGLEFTSPFGVSILTYITGLLFYGFHFPESRWPGKFDTWGASHQIWHSFIILAIILHYRAIFVAHAVRYEYSCRAVDSGRAVSEVVEDIWKTVFGGY